MSKESTKMDILMGLGIPSIVKIDSTTAMMKLPPSWECMINVSSPTYKWTAMSEGKMYDWQTSEAVPDEVRGSIQKVTTMYNDALMDLIDLGE